MDKFLFFYLFSKLLLSTIKKVLIITTFFKIKFTIKIFLVFNFCINIIRNNMYNYNRKKKKIKKMSAPRIFKCVFFSEVNFKEKIQSLAEYYDIVQVSICKDAIYLLTTHCENSMIYYKIPTMLCKTFYVAPEYDNKTIRFQINVKQWSDEYKDCKRKTNILYGISMTSQNLENNCITLDYIHYVTNDHDCESSNINIVWNPHLILNNLFNGGVNLPDKNTCHSISIPFNYLKKELPYLALFSPILDWCFIPTISTNETKNNPSQLHLITVEPNTDSSQGYAHLQLYNEPEKNIFINPQLQFNYHDNQDQFQNQEQPQNQEKTEHPVIHQKYFMYDFSILYKSKLMCTINNIQFYTKQNSPLLILSEYPNQEQVFLYLKNL